MASGEIETCSEGFADSDVLWRIVGTVLPIWPVQEKIDPNADVVRDRTTYAEYVLRVEAE